MWAIIPKLFKGLGIGIDIADTAMDVLLRGDMKTVKEKLGKMSGDEKGAAKIVEGIDKLKPSFLDLTADDEIIIKKLLMNFRAIDQATFGGFILWLKKKSLIEHNILKRFFVRCVTSGNEATGLTILREVIDMLNDTGDCKTVFNYCEATFLVNDSAYETYKKLREEIENLLKKFKAVAKAGYEKAVAGYEFIDAQCATNQPIGQASQDFLEKARKFNQDSQKG